MITLRKAVRSDCRTVFEWISDPTVQAAAFSQAPILWERHHAWFEAKVDDPTSLILIAEQEGTPLGQVRFETSSGSVEVSIIVGAAWRGRGLGRRLLAEACASFFQATKAREIHAWVRADNPASLKAFLAAGFSLESSQERKGVPADHLLLRRPA